MIVALQIAAGLALIVAGIWLAAGLAAALIAAGVSLLAGAYLTEQALRED